METTEAGTIDWKQLYEITEQQRKEWAERCIYKQARIEELERERKSRTEQMAYTFQVGNDAKADNLQLIKKLSSFREKLSNITVDEILKDPGIVIKLFDEHFGV